MNGMKVVVEHDGVEYGGTVMRIRSTHLGYEDHGIFSAYLHCEGAGSGVSVGGFALDTWSEEDKRRIGTSYGMEHIAAIMRTVGVEKWEDIAGRDILVLWPEVGNGWGQRSVGIASLMGERVLILEKHAEDWRARETEVLA